MNYKNQLFETLIKNNIYSFFRDNISDLYLANMYLIRKFNKGFRFLFCFIDAYRKYPWFILLNVIKDIKIAKIIQKSLNETYHKPRDVGK